MTDTGFDTYEPIPAALAQRAQGTMRAFNEAGVLGAADVHVALRLQKLGGESSEAVLLVAALAVRAVRAGSVCLDLTRLRDAARIDDEGEGGDGDDSVPDLDELDWPDETEVVDALRRSPLVIGASTGPLRPLRLVDTDEGALLYLDRYFRQEQTIRRILDERARSRPAMEETVIRAGLVRLFDSTDAGAGVDRQRLAAALAASSWTTVIAGGPGTGKTHTVARILSLLASAGERQPRIGLAAPTGKAAARLQESVLTQAEELDLPADLQAKTLHRLLGWQRGSSRFRFGPDNRLPYDVIVVDETSMVSLTMMCRLLEAVRGDARLVLVGDPDQLTSVDAGAVLADLVARPTKAQPNPALGSLVPEDLAVSESVGSESEVLTESERERLGAGVVRLTRGRRFGGDISALAAAVRSGDADTALDLLQRGSPAISLHDPDDVDGLRADVVTTADNVHHAAESGDAKSALAALESHRLLCAHRDGPFGVQRWATQALGWVSDSVGHRLDPQSWYPGQPLLVTANDYDTRIYNGDAGVIVRGENGDPTAAFERGDGVFLVHPSQLSAVQTVYAMTIHRSQGSQYDTVSVVLPGPQSSLLTRELLYTAITRARKRVRVIGTEAAVRAGIERQVLRASGLRREVSLYDGVSPPTQP
ncbi:MAG: exodeoxyribonuclease V subunit alpha [Rhodococcus sp.]|nr:exodeoxyribonuclease V subunit alpha [Rhodococcus sp. (in: high G+C Gram-positive bacteria)]